ncbi:hypothetical protein GUJ93_ZPchr0005g14430 [Zizania palustris]|uniref:Uncharacterized protein n=1 Tax=Zizania palustris TaxID=103762 RepID=A0A8J5SMC8_ZIZPA|nr:hypothetical protein GUJ93_ZPchr0005g14430 [Zizania palustris]
MATMQCECSLEIDDLGDDILMDNLFDVAELYGTQEMLDPDATFELSPPEDRNCDFPSLGSTDGLTDTSVEVLTEGMLNDPLLQDELENSE